MSDMIVSKKVSIFRLHSDFPKIGGDGCVTPFTPHRYLCAWWFLGGLMRQSPLVMRHYCSFWGDESSKKSCVDFAFRRVLTLKE